MGGHCFRSAYGEGEILGTRVEQRRDKGKKHEQQHRAQAEYQSGEFEVLLGGGVSLGAGGVALCLGARSRDGLCGLVGGGDGHLLVSFLEVCLLGCVCGSHAPTRIGAF